MMKNTSPIRQEKFFAARSTFFVLPDTISVMNGENVQDVLQRNLMLLREIYGWSNKEIARRAGNGVSDRTIGLILNKVHMPGIDKLERIAGAFGLNAYHLLMPDFRPEIVKNGRFDRIYHAYVDTDDDGRRVMETTADYVSRHKRPSSNDERHEGNHKSA